MSEEIEKSSIVVPRSIITSILLEWLPWLCYIAGHSLYARQYWWCFEHFDWVPIHESVSSSNRLCQENDCHGVHRQYTGNLCYHWVCGDFLSNDMILCSWSRPAILKIFEQGQIEWVWSFTTSKFADEHRQIDSDSSTPLYSITVTTVLACLLALINLGSSTVLNDVLSLTIADFYGTYFAATSLLLWRRCTGGIQDPTPGSQSARTIDSKSGEFRLVWDPLRLRGVWGILNNIFGCAYLIVIWVFSFWPPTNPTSPSTKNYSSLVTDFVVLFSIVYYFVRDRRVYTGPIVEIGHDGQWHVNIDHAQNWKQ